MIIANMATFPARQTAIVQAAQSILPQVDRLNICFNQYDTLPAWLRQHPKINGVIPRDNLKDVGKFLFEVGPDDDVLLCDDDILYPADYVTKLRQAAQMTSRVNAVVGVHGVIYADLFDGGQKARRVYVFYLPLDEFKVVNQLGTGTVLLKGRDMPSLDFMMGSQGFVDVRFARHLRKSGVPLICIPRAGRWMKEINTGGGLFEGFTQKWPNHVVREVQEIAGYGKLDTTSLVFVDRISSNT